MAGSSSYSKTEQLLNVLSHLLGFMGALLGLVLLLAKAEGGLAVSAVAIYGGSMALLFLASCLYHAVSEVRWQARLKLFDHAAIYLLIAGTYTPILLLAFDGWLSWLSMLVIWLLAAVGIAFKLLTGVRFPKLSLGTYLVMGWLALALAYPMYLHIPPAGLAYLLLGGVLFSIGALFYVAEHKAYTHAIWHLFVVAGCACHFISVYRYIVPVSR